MIMQPKVSVLIPVYNRSDLIVRAVRSVLNQTHQNLEVVISDNASTDDTWSVVERLAAADSRIRTFRNATNLGPTRNWIAGLERCSGEYLKVLWSDDWIEPTFIEELLEPMHDQPDVSLAFSAALVHLSDRDESPHFFPHQRWFTASDYLRRSLTGHMMPVSPACALIRSSAARFRLPIGTDPRLNDIAERFGAGPDLLMLLDAATASKRVAHIPRFLTHFAASKTSITCLHPAEVQEGYQLTREFFTRDMANHPTMRAIRAHLTVRRWRQTVRRVFAKRN